MSEKPPPSRLAMLTAEEILRTIYGDDFAGCKVSLEAIGELVATSLQQAQAQTQELLDLYEKLVEAIDLLSTPPDAAKITDPAELRILLSQRLDAIHALTTKTRDTTARVKARG